MTRVERDELSGESRASGGVFCGTTIPGGGGGLKPGGGGGKLIMLVRVKQRVWNAYVIYISLFKVHGHN